MAYRVVHRTPNPPHKCIVSGFSDGPFLDTGVESPYIEPWVYLNVQVLKDMAKVVGMVPEEDLAAVNELNAELESEVERLRTELFEQDTVIQAIDTMESADFRARKKAGRPKTKAE